ncbi:hypothetical protein D3C81_1910630 [compost metagenome]
MTDDAVVIFGHQRHRQRTGPAQRIDDELLGVAAVWSIGKGSAGKAMDGIAVGGALVADLHGRLLYREGPV